MLTSINTTKRLMYDTTTVYVRYSSDRYEQEKSAIFV